MRPPAHHAPFVLFGLSGRLHEHPPGTSDWVDLHWYRCMAVLAGTIDFDDGQAVHHLRPGMAALVAPRVRHRTTISPDLRVLRADFTVTARDLEMRNPRGPTYVPADGAWVDADPVELWGAAIPTMLPPTASARTIDGLRLICDRWWRGPLDRLRAHAHLGLLLADLAAISQGQTAGEPAVADDDAGSLLDRAEMRGRALVEQGITVRDLASSIGLSRQHFCRLYHQRRGYPPAVFLRRIRLERARELLAQGATVTVAAQRCGWKDPGSLTRAFVRLGLPVPRSYRGTLLRSSR